MAGSRISSKLFASRDSRPNGGAPPAISVPQENTSVGRRLHEIRASRALSLRALAKLSGLNVNTLSLIENDRTSPSVSTLQRLSHCLMVPLTEFFRQDERGLPLVYQKAGRRLPLALEVGAVEDLASGMRQPGAEPLIITLHVGASSGNALIVHPGREFVYCLEGCISYIVQDNEYSLELGDSLCFEAHLPHRWCNAGEAPARALLVLCPVDRHESPRQAHFAV